MAAHYFKCHGLTIASEYDLPGLLKCNSCDHADVTIRKTSHMDIDVQHIKGQRLYELSDNNHLFIVDGIATFNIVSGKKIEIEACGNATLWDIRIYLLSHVMNILLNQRNRFLFHGCSILKNDKATLFTGHSVVAKSILGQEFNIRGYHLLSDDLNSVDPRNNEVFISVGMNHSSSHTENIANSFCNSRFKLHEIAYLLTDSDATHFEIEKISGAHKIILLNSCIFKNRLTEKKHVELFKKNSVIADNCDISILKMPVNNFHIDKLINLVSGG